MFLINYDIKKVTQLNSATFTHMTKAKQLKLPVILHLKLYFRSMNFVFNTMTV